MSDAATSPSFSLQFRAARHRRHMSQSDAARVLGTTQQTVARWENGQVPQQRFRQRIEAFLEEGEPSGQVLRLRSPVPPDEMNERQSRAFNALLRRMQSGDPLAAHEARTFRALFVNAGLEWPSD